MGSLVKHDEMEELDNKTFDETKAGVKGLVDSGVESVPKIFIKSPEVLSQPEHDASKDPHIQVPVIDLARAYDRDDITSRPAIVKEILHAAEEWGFFQILNHGIPLNATENMLKGIQKFNEQDPDVKKEYYTRDFTKSFGFTSSYDLYKSGASWKDTLLFNERGDGKFDPKAIPEACRNEYLEYASHCKKLGVILLELLSLSLGLRPHHLEEMVIRDNWSLAAHYAPPCPQPELTLAAMKHSDPTFLTLLLQDQIGGLQVLYKDQWVNVQPIPGALIVNIGDLLQIMSNDKLKSVYHRVKANRDGPRISAAFFFSGSYTSSNIHICGPIKELTSMQNPPVYRDFTMKEFFTQMSSQGVAQSRFERFKIKP